MKTVNVTSYNKYGPSTLPEGVPNAGGTMSSRQSDHTLVYNGKRLGIGYSEADTWVNRGPGMGRKFITTPEAYAFGLCTVIDNYGGTGAEAARNRAAGTEHDVEIGDYVIFDGDLVFRVNEYRDRYRRDLIDLDFLGRLADIIERATLAAPAS